MECPNCYDVEVCGISYQRIRRRVYLQMNLFDSDRNYLYYQCPRCRRTLQQNKNSGSSGLIEDVSIDEIKRRKAEDAEEAACALGTILKIGAGVTIGALILSAITGNGSSSSTDTDSEFGDGIKRLK